MASSTVLQELTRIGESLGLQGAELRDFVKSSKPKTERKGNCYVKERKKIESFNENEKKRDREREKEENIRQDNEKAREIEIQERQRKRNTVTAAEKRGRTEAD